MKHPIKDFKDEQKARVAKIKESKKRNLWLRSEYRHHHIAYCELRGTVRDRIERPAEHNRPNEDWITRIKSEWQPRIREWREQREALCAG